MDDSDVNRQTIVDNLSTQSVLAGRVLDMNIVTQLGMDTQHDIMVIQSRIHLFDTKSLFFMKKKYVSAITTLSFRKMAALRQE